MPTETQIVKHVLIAEDDTPVARALALKLKGSGFEVTVTNNGEATLEALKNEKFDVLLLDLIMPKKDGFAVLQELKKNGTAIKTFVLTNLGQEEDRKRVEELGAAGYYIKADTPLSQIVELVKSA